MQVTEKGKNGRLESVMKRREEGRREEQSIALGLEREGRREEGWDQGQVGHTERESKTRNIEGKER